MARGFALPLPAGPVRGNGSGPASRLCGPGSCLSYEAAPIDPEDRGQGRRCRRGRPDDRGHCRRPGHSSAHARPRVRNRFPACHPGCVAAHARVRISGRRSGHVACRAADVPSVHPQPVHSHSHSAWFPCVLPRDCSFLEYISYYCSRKAGMGILPPGSGSQPQHVARKNPSGMAASKKSARLRRPAS